MRYAVFLIGCPLLLACATGLVSPASAGPLMLAQMDGGGIGGSLEAPETRTVHARPRASRAAAPRTAPASRVIVKREVVYEPRYVTRPAAPQRRSAGQGAGLASYDGVWSVSSGGCSGAGTGQVMISGGRISSSSGSGSVSPSGAVSTVSTVNGLTIVGQGRITGQFASGVYRQSDGCTGSWSAVKL